MAAVMITVDAASSRRGRFYRPFYNHGQDVWNQQQVQLHFDKAHWLYQPREMDPKPIPEPEENNLYGKKRLWNPVQSSATVAAQKHEEFGWPYREPAPTGLRRSWEYFPYWFERYFPNVQARLVVDSVLNNETMEPRFRFPATMSKQEISNYLQNVHGFEGIDAVETRNYSGLRYKNEIGTIKQMEDYKEATVRLESPVLIELKQVKETSDVGDGKERDQM
jgi:large subunit ribosomal protein L23